MTRGPATVLVVIALALAGASAALAQEPSPPEDQEIGRLMTQTAKRGTLKPVKGKPRFTLELRGVAPQVVWFDDRPGRETGQIPVGHFVRSWTGFGFEEVPPNAALTLLDAADHEDTVVLKLGKPRYKKKTRTVRYPAHVLDAATGNLSHLESQRDDGVPRRFRAASLFIDDAGYGLPTGCQPDLPYITCTYTSSTTLSVDSVLSAIEYSHPIDSSAALWMQAWGGRGAKGASASAGTADGAYGGYAGYGIAVSTVDLLLGETLYLYVGAGGSKRANSGGQGGASTIVSTQPISAITDFPGGVQVIAGGSGGGARGCSGSRGGAGGVAIGSNHVSDANGAGQSGQGPNHGGGGSGGNGGAAGGYSQSPGASGLGGYGGPGDLTGTVGWGNLDEVDPAIAAEIDLDPFAAAPWTPGAGGGGFTGGGGGYGGGGGGASCGGGGGGGSWARGVPTVNGNIFLDEDAPTDSKQGDGAQSKVVLTFHLG